MLSSFFQLYNHLKVSFYTDAIRIKETYRVALLLNRINSLQCSCLIEQGIKWKKKEGSLLLTYTETLLA